MLNKMKKNLKNKKGFTLVEILTVVSLIAILFVIFVPRLDFATNKVRESGLQSDFRSYQLAFEQVARQNSGMKSFAESATPTEEEAKALAKVVNSYLDKKLQLTVNAPAQQGEAPTFSLDIEDPWKVDYQFYWDYANDAMYVFSCGPDKLSNGDTAAELLTTTGDGNDVNADNYSVKVQYSVNGLSIQTTGFDNNIDR